MCASYWALTSEQTRQESVFHHLMQKQTENEGRSERLVLLNRMPKTSRLPWSTLSLSPPPLHCPTPPFVFPSQLQGETWLRAGREIPLTWGHLQRLWPATQDPGGPVPSPTLQSWDLGHAAGGYQMFARLRLVLRCNSKLD